MNSLYTMKKIFERQSNILAEYMLRRFFQESETKFITLSKVQPILLIANMDVSRHIFSG
jgi:hypothetical protein